MACDKCNSKRVVSISAKCSDLCSSSFQGHEKQGYVPDAIGVGGGDYADFSYCLDCGKLQGSFPVTQDKVNEAFDIPTEPYQLLISQIEYDREVRWGVNRRVEKLVLDDVPVDATFNDIHNEVERIVKSNVQDFKQTKDPDCRASTGARIYSWGQNLS